MATKPKIDSTASQAPLWAFNTQFDKRPPVFQHPGDPEKSIYHPKLQPDGTIELEETGKEDFYGYIQSHKDSCDIHVLLKRFENGDETALSRMQGIYGDFTQTPKTFAEALNAMIAGEQMFDRLPAEVKAKFDNSLEKFMVSMDDMPSFLDKLGYSSDSTETSSGSSKGDDTSKSEVKQDES